jgi:hypothetical protein
MLHHERKPMNGERGDAGFASIGSVYWQNLADTTYAVVKRASETEETDEGVVRTTTVAVEVTKDPRSGVPADVGNVAVVGTFGHDGELLSTTFRRTEDPGIQALVQAITLAGEPLMRGKLADAAEMSDSGRFHKLVRAALDAGAIIQPGGKGKPYAVPEMETTA